MNYNSAINFGSKILKKNLIKTASIDSEIILSKTLNLTCLGIIGTARSLTVLMPMSDGLIDSNNRYSEKKNNDNVVVDEASPILYVGGTNVKIISMLSIVTWEHLDNVFALHWENTNTNSIYRQNYLYH